MLFTSYSYFAFLATVLVAFALLPWRPGRWVLVAGSYLFYGAAEPWYCLLLLSGTLVHFQAAKALGRDTSPARRRLLLWSAVGFSLFLLGLFKYSAFAVQNVNLLLWGDQGVLPVPDWVLPIGISFYTFQTIAYTVDVYRGRAAATRDFAAFALYVAFFPQLIAGPIERANTLLVQLLRTPRPTREDVEAGVARILLGLIKKTVFSDRLAVFVNEVYADPAYHSTPELAAATLCFSFQLYLDFSAYTDIAIGTARLMGIRLSENFNYPFLARNPSEFWSRWHRTLTSWFRDYVFRPLGGMKRGRPVRSALNLVIVMTLIGLWHGADWTFVLFGLVSGLLLAAHTTLRLHGPRSLRGGLLGRSWWSTPLAILIGNIVLNLLMVLFRSPDLATAMGVYAGLVGGGWSWSGRYDPYLAMLAVLWGIHVWRATGAPGLGWFQRAPLLRGAGLAGLALLLLYGAAEQGDPFIYFQF